MAQSTCHILQIAVYGPDQDSALHMAIKQDSQSAALALINNGADVDFSNWKVSYSHSILCLSDVGMYLLNYGCWLCFRV
jgi:ankyrin repeat protein